MSLVGFTDRQGYQCGTQCSGLQTESWPLQFQFRDADECTPASKYGCFCGLRVFSAMSVDPNFHARAACERKRYEYWVPVSFFMQDGGLVPSRSHMELLRDVSFDGWGTVAGVEFKREAGGELVLSGGSLLLVREHAGLQGYATSELQFEVAVKFSGKATFRVALRQAGKGWFVASREQMLTETSYLLGDLHTKNWLRYDPSTNTIAEEEEKEHGSSNSAAGDGGLDWSHPLDAFGLLVCANEPQTLLLERVRVLGPASESEAESAKGLEGDRLALLALLKPILKRFEAAEERSFHNFSRGVSSHESRAKRAVRMQCLGFLQVQGTEFLGFSISGRHFLFGMHCKIMGLVLAIARNLLPRTRILDICFDPRVSLELPVAPSHLLFLAECSYTRFEVSTQTQVNPRESRYARGFTAPAVFEAIAAHRTALLRHLIAREEAEHARWTGAIARQAAMLLEDLQGQSSLPQQQRASSSPSPSKFSACPLIFTRALRLLREADRGGLWPASSVRRSALLEQGGSFTLGWMPPPLSAPSANALFPELHEALMQLEQRIAPQRAPSSTIAVNRHASFRPHRDSGAGAGQGISLIVGLGDFAGGQLSCDPLHGDGPPEVHDVRYNPLLFHGWEQRHWTLPFTGERFSIVWFTPKGCEQWQLQIPPSIINDKGRCSCCTRFVHSQTEGSWACWYCDPHNFTDWRCAFRHPQLSGGD